MVELAATDTARKRKRLALVLLVGTNCKMGKKLRGHGREATMQVKTNTLSHTVGDRQRQRQRLKGEEVRQTETKTEKDASSTP